MTRTARETLEAVVAALVPVPTLELSKQIIDGTWAPTTRTTIAKRWYSPDLQTVNTRGLRDRHAMELQHTLTLRVLVQLNVNDQIASLLETLDFEDSIVQALANPSSTPSIRWRYEKTSRRLVLPAREYLYLEIAFTLNVDHDLGQAT